MLLYDGLLEENREMIEQRETNSFYKMILHPQILNLIFLMNNSVWVGYTAP